MLYRLIYEARPALLDSDFQESIIKQFSKSLNTFFENSLKEKELFTINEKNKNLFYYDNSLELYITREPFLIKRIIDFKKDIQPVEFHLGFTTERGKHRSTSGLLLNNAEVGTNVILFVSLLGRNLDFYKSRINLVLPKTIKHELVHVRDIFSASSKALSDSEYFNESHEVKAFLVDIVSETEPLVKELIGEQIPTKAILRRIFLSSPTWKLISKFLNEKNKKYIYKSLYTFITEHPHQTAVLTK